LFCNEIVLVAVVVLPGFHWKSTDMIGNQSHFTHLCTFNCNCLFCCFLCLADWVSDLLQKSLKTNIFCWVSY